MIRACLVGFLAVCCAASQGAAAGCERAYVVLGSAGGRNLYMQGDRPAGFLPDLAAEVAARSGCHLSVQILPHERLILMGDKQMADILGNVSRGGTRPSDRDFIEIALLDVELVLPADSKIEALEQLAARTDALVGRLRRAAEPPEVKAFFAQLDPARIDVSDDSDTLARKLAAGRIQAFFGTPLFLAGSIEAAGINGRVRRLPLASPPYRIGWSMLHANVSAADRALLAKTLMRMRQDGTIETVLARHVGRRAAEKSLRREP
ncbi:transporter substrate-binding domain-containing protein [Niveibacterium sp. 24ML]|uniref:substrate-binding periplasmic protein n=1 Tax=Niveibacterium sp. 24ML TaxID=2985512 RepID=UPI00226E3C3E|nr:transporter substrate-binding domain-containing protein [Niveibacterium sp. 24ML]MCX9157731.1 transporter substrate-binding domain-containing protein [Niveibacterium sp. 24ML]